MTSPMKALRAKHVVRDDVIPALPSSLRCKRDLKMWLGLHLF
jgi:hypothetical protein